ncbi:MAG: UDP-4-amino-4,6-dideoxy-N-acetyl-beta-L-altrosamine transaminase [Candidatus Margulisbacteria bacterium]|nr:UDP-4-amino-4,6-dideoxy-N-acetyl-beta-L-altrosamine transaminase [Candidatus Margulisiibacteriota bacterium]MBU1617128.1 UDP-4-amino-4,6-dideoxy-N-acetyl-beta-L-altrosamine transaminase [Candidatus Margulisiibacteriota bacterium]
MKTIPYATQWIDEEDIQAVAAALRSSHLTQGPLVDQFEAAVAAYCGAKYAVAFNSGTSALHGACFAAGLIAGDEAITSPITFVASANAILYCGAKPVFADIDPQTINLDPAAVAVRLTAKTKVLLPVHFAGQPCDLVALSKLAKERNLIVIEDACHALGADYQGEKIGAGQYSDMTILSFHAVKHITTGEGGMVLTNNKEFAQKLKTFRTHGITRDPQLLAEKDPGPWVYEMQALGFNYRLTDFQSALGISQLKKLDQFVARRREIVARYQAAFKIIPGLATIQEKPGCRSAWHIYPVMVKGDRRERFDSLRKVGIGVNVHYIPVYRQPYYRKLGYAQNECPQAENYYESAITLPLYPRLKDEEVDYVISKVKEVMAK